MAFRYSRSAMTGAAIVTLAGVTVLPLAQANAAPVSPQGEGVSSASQNAQGQQQGANANAQGQQAQGATQDQQQGANASGQNQDGATQGGAAQDQQGANASNQSQDGATQGGATQDPSQAASGSEQQQAQPGATQDQQQGANAGGQDKQASQGQGASSASQNGQGQQAQGAPASQSSSNSNSASQNNQSQPSAPANQNSGFIAITSVDGFIDPQNTDNVLSVETTGIDNTHRVQYEPRVQELDEFGNIVNDDVSNGGGSSLGSDGSFGMYVSVDGTKINPNHQYRVYIDVFDQDTLTASYAYYPIVVWNRTYIPVVPLSVAQ